jgi:hypothetical protein
MYTPSTYVKRFAGRAACHVPASPNLDVCEHQETDR